MKFSALLRDETCLSFANTRYWRGSATPTETLRDPENLLTWAAETGGAVPELVEECRARWRPGDSAKWLAKAIAVRERIYRLFVTTAARLPPVDADLAALNEALQAGPRRSELIVLGTECRWQIDACKPTLEALLAPVSWSAGDLLASTRLARVRTCANEDCRRLFLDTSKSGVRRWCNMSTCGNQAKARRHYDKRRQFR